MNYRLENRLTEQWNIKNLNSKKNKMKTQKFLFAVSLLIAFSTGYAQDSTQTEKNQKILSAIPGNTKMVLTGVAWFGFPGTPEQT